MRFTGDNQIIGDNQFSGNQLDPILFQGLNVKSITGEYFFEKVVWKGHSGRVVFVSGAAVATSRSGQWILCLTHIRMRKPGLALHISIIYISGEMEGFYSEA